MPLLSQEVIQRQHNGLLRIPADRVAEYMPDLAIVMNSAPVDLSDYVADIMAERELDPKSINGVISKVARRWFMEQLDKEAGL